jgi:peptidoglycan/xylan/chitin deacetylase (PgdA/CDA1 family)
MWSRARILAFHQIADRFYPGINTLRPRQFRAILNLWRQWGGTFWSGTDGKTPGILPPAVITFDDGYADNFDLLLELRALDITPIVFAATGFIGQANRWEYSGRWFPARHLEAGQLRELAEGGVLIGSHGISHKALTAMTSLEVRQELAASKEILEEISGRQVDLVSFPFGRVSPEVCAIARACGYRLGFGFGEVPASLSADGFLLGRIPIYGCDDYFSLRGKLLVDSRLESVKNGIINNLAAGTIVLSRLLK